MTELAQTYLGNLNEKPDLSHLLKIETCIEVYLSESDRAKGRIHIDDDSGITVGIIKSRDWLLREGDVFHTQQGKLLLIHLQDTKLMVLSFSGLGTDVLPVKLVHLGHVLGNHHYPIVVENNQIYVQLVTDPAVIEQTIRDFNIPGLEINYEMRSPQKELNFYKDSHKVDEQ
jgi:urease accessory protein